MKRRLLVLAWASWVSLLASAQYEFEVPYSERNEPSECYVYKNGRRIAQRCVPEFINIAFNREVHASNTCGEAYPIKFCQQTGNQHIHRSCDMCNGQMIEYSHPSRFLTDFDNPDHKTWWQSETKAQGIQNVNLSISFGKAFDVTYVRLTFISFRPESFAIYKRVHGDSEWTPWQFYSGSCIKTYKLRDKAPILPGNEAVAQCTSDFSDISPLTGGVVAFSTLEGRPSAEGFEESEVLQDWVTATEVLIKLDRMNTYGDEIYNDQRVLESYYYAISDLAIGGRCKCNGHASECTRSTGHGFVASLVCNCQHGTYGPDCSECDSFHQDRPWRAATSTESNECLPCNCNGLSNRCFFDEALYNRTGSGGHCVDCSGGTTGVNCHECLPSHFRRPQEKHCIPCQCSETGSFSQQCDKNGQCPCKPGVGGLKCDQCENGFYGFGSSGCQDCGCNSAGSLPRKPMCSQDTGKCHCKPNVEGEKCDRCRPSYFNLESSNQLGCTLCFCYGHSSVCSSAHGYYTTTIASMFEEGTEEWSAGSILGPEPLQYDMLEKAAVVSQMRQYPVYFYVPKKYLGDLRFSYDHVFGFTLRTMFNGSTVGASDIKIVGNNNQSLVLSIKSCKTGLTPNVKNQQFYFWLHPDQGWHPRLHELDFIGLLSNVTELSIRGTYTNGDVGYLYNFTLQSASKFGEVSLGNRSDVQATWIEQCSCGKEYDGQFCEKCAPGYKRIHKFGGPSSRCIPCQCNNHSNSCEAESGACRCEHNTAGDDCQQCARGYYGNALDGKPDSCKKCDCPKGGPCVVEDGQVLCTECAEGSMGDKCQFCMDGYFKNFMTNACDECQCNGNVDPNAVGNCDQKSGICRNCIKETTGDNCEYCKPGYWGDPTSDVDSECRPCNCYQPGSAKPDGNYTYLECSKANGQCSCLPGVTGTQCNKCQEGYFNIASRHGCEPCNCDPIGSVNATTCDAISGECNCKPGIVGRQCSMCAPLHHSFTLEGCKRCQCNQFGAESEECDVNNGQCLCRDNVLGHDCSYCAENWYDLRRGCVLECDDCYNLIQKRKNQINDTKEKLAEDLHNISKTPVQINDEYFKSNVENVTSIVNILSARTQNVSIANYEALKSSLNNSLAYKRKFEAFAEKFDRLSQLTDFNLETLLKEYDQLNRDVINQLHNLNKDSQRLFRELNERRQTHQKSETNSLLNEMAKNAQDILAETEQKVVEIEKLVLQAESKSKQALKEAKETVFEQEPYGEKTAKLQLQLQSLVKQFTDLHQLNQHYLDESQKLTESALMLIKVEKPNTYNLFLRKDGQTFEEGMRADYKQLIDNANKHKEKSANYTQQQTSAKKLSRELGVWFERAKEENRKLDRQLEKANKHQQKAIAEMNKANRVFENAEQTLKLIKDYTEDPNRNLKRYLQELKNIESLEVTLNAVEKELNLLEVEVPSNQFEFEDVQTKANFAKQKAEQYKRSSDSLQKLFDKLDTMIDEQTKAMKNLHADLKLINKSLLDQEKSTTDYSKQSDESLARAEKANKKAHQLSEQINESARLLDEALDNLKSFDPSSVEALDQLESEFNRLNDLVTHMNFDEDLKNTKAQLDVLEQNSLKSTVLHLEAEYKKLQTILDNLPTKCFHTVKLESN